MAVTDNIVIKLTLDSKGNDSVVRNLEEGLQKIVNSALQAKTNTGSFFQNLMGSFTGINQGLELARKAVDFFSKPVTIAMDMEQAQVSFEVLLGSAEAADKMISQFKEDAAKTPYEFTDLQDAGKVLLNFGITADKVRPTLMMLGDIAGGNSQKFQQLALVMGQVSSAGKLQGQDLLQLINAGFNPLQEISRTTGKSMADLRKEMEDGKISYAMVEGAFRSATSEGGRFYKMMEKQSLTLGGLMSTLSDNINQGLASFANSGLFQNIKKVIQDIGKTIEDNKQTITSTINAVGSVIAFLFRSVVDYYKFLIGFYRFLWDWKPLILGIAAAVGVLTVAINAGTIVSMAQTVALKAMYLWDNLVIKAKQIWTGVQWALNAAMSANPIALVIAGIVALVAVIYTVIEKTIGWGKAWAYIKTALEIAWMYIKAFGNSIMGFADGLLQVLTFPWQVMYQTAAEVFGKIGTLMKKLISGDFTGVFGELTSGISKGFSDAMDNISTSFRRALGSFDGLAAQAKKKWSEASDWKAPAEKSNGKTVVGEDKPLANTENPLVTNTETNTDAKEKKGRESRAKRAKDKTESGKMLKDQSDMLADEVLDLNSRAIDQLTAENEKYADKEIEDMENMLDLKQQLLYSESEMKIARLEAEYDENKAFIEAEINDEEEKARLLTALEDRRISEVTEVRRKAFEEQNRTAATAVDSVQAGFNTMYGRLFMKQREAKDNWDAAWLSMKYTALSALGEMLSAALKNYLIDTLAFGTAEETKTEAATSGAGRRIGLTIWESVKKIAIWIAEQTSFIAKEVAMTAAYLAQSAIRVAATIAEAGAALVKAVASAIAGMGPLGLLLGGGMVAAGIALFGQIKKAFGFAEGGRFKKGQSGYIEGYHDEIIAPEKTFVDIMRTELIPRIVSSVKIPPSALITATTPALAAIGTHSDPELLTEIKKLNQNFAKYAANPSPVYITQRELNKGIQNFENKNLKGRY